MACVVFVKTRHGRREQDTTASSFLTRAVVEVRCSAHRPFPAVIGSQWLRQPAGAPEEHRGNIRHSRGNVARAAGGAVATRTSPCQDPLVYYVIAGLDKRGAAPSGSS